MLSSSAPARPKRRLVSTLVTRAEGDGAFRDDHVILVDHGFGDFEIHGLAHVRVGGGDVVIEAKAYRRAVLEREYLGGGGQDEEKSTGETHDEPLGGRARGLPKGEGVSPASPHPPARCPDSDVALIFVSC
jgi:hypothetical protein